MRSEIVTPAMIARQAPLTYHADYEFGLRAIAATYPNGTEAQLLEELDATRAQLAAVTRDNERLREALESARVRLDNVLEFENEVVRAKLAGKRPNMAAALNASVEEASAGIADIDAALSPTQPAPTEGSPDA